MKSPVYGKLPEAVTDAQVTTGGVNIYGFILNGGTTATSVTFTDSDSSDAVVFKAPHTDDDASSASSTVCDLTNLPLPFPGGCTVTLAGTGASLYVWADNSFADAS